MPAGVQWRENGLLDRQDQSQLLTAAQHREAEGLLELAEMLSRLQLRASNGPVAPATGRRRSRFGWRQTGGRGRPGRSPPERLRTSIPWFRASLFFKEGRGANTRNDAKGRNPERRCLPCFASSCYTPSMSAVELALEKVKHLDETSARQLLAWFRARADPATAGCALWRSRDARLRAALSGSGPIHRRMDV